MYEVVLRGYKKKIYLTPEMSTHTHNMSIEIKTKNFVASEQMNESNIILYLSVRLSIHSVDKDMFTTHNHPLMLILYIIMT